MSEEHLLVQISLGIEIVQNRAAELYLMIQLAIEHIHRDSVTMTEKVLRSGKRELMGILRTPAIATRQPELRG